MLALLLFVVVVPSTSVPCHYFVGYSLYCSLLADSYFEAFLLIVLSCLIVAFGDAVEETADKMYAMDLFHQRSMNGRREEMLVCSAAPKAAAGDEEESRFGPP